MPNSIQPYLILLLPPLFWSGNFIIGRSVAEVVDPIALSFWRWGLALLILLPFVIKPIIRQRDLITQHLGRITALALLSISGFNTLAYIGLQYTTATNGTLLNSFIPIFIVIISTLFFKEQTTPRKILGVSISFTGVLIILTKLNLEVLMHLSINKGDLWILLATIVWALYSILLKYYRPAEMEALTFLGITTFIGTLLLIPLSLLFSDPTDFSALQNTDMQLKLLYIALFPSIVAYLAWNYGIQQVGASVGGQFIHLMPFFGAIMAVLFLDESIHIYHLLGGLGIAIGLWLSIWSHKV